MNITGKTIASEFAYRRAKWAQMCWTLREHFIQLFLFMKKGLFTSKCVTILRAFMCVYHMCALATEARSRGPKWATDPLELEVVSNSVDAGDTIWYSVRVGNAFNWWASSPALHLTLILTAEPVWIRLKLSEVLRGHNHPSPYTQTHMYLMTFW